MTIREQLELREIEYLSPYATLSKDSKGRKAKEEECDIRPVFQRDRDRILHCKAFRRMKQKTQVFLLPKGDHYRTRLTHTLEVSQNARTIAKALRLNEDLAEAISLGHDLGRRFRAREKNPDKQWKITEEDWRNREKWDQYEEAVNEMLIRTSTEKAPWIVVEGNCKYYARIKVLETVVNAIEERLKNKGE